MLHFNERQLIPQRSRIGTDPLPLLVRLLELLVESLLLLQHRSERGSQLAQSTLRVLHFRRRCLFALLLAVFFLTATVRSYWGIDLSRMFDLLSSTSALQVLYQGLGKDRPLVETYASSAMLTGRKSASLIIRKSTTPRKSNVRNNFALNCSSILTSRRRPHYPKAKRFLKILNAGDRSHGTCAHVEMDAQAHLQRLEAQDTSVAGSCSQSFGVLGGPSQNLGLCRSGVALDGASVEEEREYSEDESRIGRGTAEQRNGVSAGDRGESSEEEADVSRGNVESRAADRKGSISEGKRRKRHRIMNALFRRGTSPVELLENLEERTTESFWTIVNILCLNSRAPEALLVFEWWRHQANYVATEQDYTGFISICGRARMPEEAQRLFNEMISLDLRPTVATYSCLLQGFAEVGDFNRANEILVEMKEVGVKPNAITYTGLLYAYGKQGHYGEMAKIFNYMKTHEAFQPHCAPTSVTYSALIQCFAKGGLFARMEKALKEMLSKDWDPDGAAVNAMIRAYAEAGLVKDMERGYSLVRPYKVKVCVKTIRAVALAYIQRSYFYQLGTFARYHNRRRVTLDKLIENLLLLSHAANFSMRGLADEYVRLKDTGFEGDITSFNIRALAFSKMQMMWDLRVTILEMVQQGVMPDLVTYGAVVDAYVGRKMVSVLAEALGEMPNMSQFAEVQTDELVFCAFGRGPFQKCCEGLFEGSEADERRLFTYENLVGYYLQKT